jgi:hypothetical protein
MFFFYKKNKKWQRRTTPALWKYFAKNSKAKRDGQKIRSETTPVKLSAASIACIRERLKRESDSTLWRGRRGRRQATWDKPAKMARLASKSFLQDMLLARLYRALKQVVVGISRWDLYCESHARLRR